MASLKIGIAGKPNAGKSTLFSAITGTMVAIGNYQFTTIEPNEGVGFMETRCPHLDLGKPCNPKHGKCENGQRFVPVLVVDVPGLIEGSSEGKGMGNLFMDALRYTSAIIILLDPLDDEGHLLTAEAVTKEAERTEIEILKWFSSRFSSDWEKFVRKFSQTKTPLEEVILQKASFFNLNLKDVRSVLSGHHLKDDISKWTDEDKLQFSEIVMKEIRPMIRIVNKGDLIQNYEDFIGSGYSIISSDYELSIEKAYGAGLINSLTDLTPTDKANEKQKVALEKINQSYANGKIKRVFEIMGEMIKGRLGRIIVYPVYDDTKWVDKDGNILPDAFIMSEGETAEDLAFAVHSDIGEGFIKAINARTKMVVGRNYQLKDSDVLRIVAKTK